MCGCTRNGAARNKKQKVKASRWKMEAASRRQPACESEPAGGGTQQATASRLEQEASRRQPAYESGHARGGSQQATASRREQEASRRMSAGGRWMPAGDSEQARENRQANQREQEASRRKSAGGRRMPAGDSQQARERTDKLDRCGSQLVLSRRTLDACVLVFALDSSWAELPCLR